MLSSVWLRVRALFHHILAFPLLLLVIVIILSALRISGSSVGMYERFASGDMYKDPNIVLGQPRAIRSDEFTVNTPLVIAQSRNHFARMNKLIGNGEDMSVIVDVPYLEWSEFFRPQNWSFFVMPLEQAFAFKWWILGWGLVSSAYWLLASLLPKRRLTAAILAVSLFFSPMIQWWYQTITIAPLAYGFLIPILGVKLLHARSLKARIGFSLLLAYVLTAFALVLYPPFQIPCLIGSLAVLIGLWLETQTPWSERLKQLKWPVIAGAASVGVIGLFIVTRLGVVHDITHTVYPGLRVVKSGGFSVTQFFSGPFLSSLRDNQLASHYRLNQSEAANFILIWPMLLIPTAYLVFRRIRQHKHLPMALIMVSVALVALAGVMFVPLPAIVTKLMLVSSIPQNRLLLGMGLLGIIQIALLVREREEPWPKWLIAMTAILSMVVFAVVGLKLRQHFPGFMPRLRHFVVPVVATGIMVYGFLSKRPLIGAAALLALSVVTTFEVNPLYRGLAPLTSDSAPAGIQRLSSAHDGSRWIFNDAGSYVNFLSSQGIATYSATYIYPQLTLWRSLDPSGSNASYYNRYANAFFTVSQEVPLFSSSSNDTFVYRFDPCHNALANVSHVVSRGPLTSPCLLPRATISQAELRLYIYDIHN